MENSIREILNGIRNELLETPPADALKTSEYIVRLTAILGNIHDEMGKQERLYISNYRQIIDAQVKMASDKQKIVAMDTEAYHQLQAAKRYSELTLEMIGGLKYRSRALGDEWKQSGNQ